MAACAPRIPPRIYMPGVRQTLWCLYSPRQVHPRRVQAKFHRKAILNGYCHCHLYKTMNLRYFPFTENVSKERNSPHTIRLMQ
jgi:hypothetical protein